MVVENTQPSFPVGQKFGDNVADQVWYSKHQLSLGLYNCKGTSRVWCNIKKHVTSLFNEDSGWPTNQNYGSLTKVEHIHGKRRRLDLEMF